MTDEEKAIKDLCIKCSSYDFCVKGNQLHCAETVAYIKGVAEGRKEQENKVTELTEKLEKINSIVWKTEHKFMDFEKIKTIIMG